MPETFDPYYKWLGIPPAQQPPHHYRLLGIELFESDIEVIDMAANQRMSYLQEMAGGAHGKHSQRLLNEVSAARRCLLDKAAKAAYDEQLRAKLPKPSVVVESRPDAGSLDDTIHVAKTVSLPAGKIAAAQPREIRPPAAKPAAPTAAETDSAFNFIVGENQQGKPSKSKTTTGKPAAKPTASRGGDKPADVSDARRKPTLPKKSRAPIYALAIVLLAAAAGGGFEFYRRSQTKPEQSAVVATTPDGTATPTPTPTGSMLASSAPQPTASPTSTEDPYAIFTNATRSQTQPGIPTGAGGSAKPPGAAPTAGGGKSPIVAAAESGTPPDRMFLAGAAPNAAAPSIHLHPQRNLPRRLVGFFKSGADYHLFYQSITLPRRPGNDLWGHCVSSNLLDWQEVPLTATYDPKLPAEIGSIFVDAANASGLGEEGKPVWLAVCTITGSKQTELVYAASRDLGATWAFAPEPLKVEGGFPAGIAAPRVVRDPERKQWCLVASTREVAKPPSTTYTLYTSSDLKTWTKKQDIPLGEGSGAPDFFEIAEPAPAKARRWIFTAGNGRFMLGQFDGDRFTTDLRGGRLFGSGYGSFRTLDDSPGETRRLAIGLVLAPAVAKQPAYGRAVALPQVFSLAGGEANPTLRQIECDEVRALDGKSINRAAGDLAAGAPIVIDDCGPIFRFNSVFEAGRAEAVEVALFGEKVRVDFKAKTLTIAGVSSPYEATSIRLDGIVDRDIAELQTPIGRVALPTQSGPGSTPLKVEAFGGTAKLQSVQAIPLVRPAGKP
jgi:hypothetical protein